MKNLTKIFMAVMAGMLAFSCVTDITEDLGVNLGEGQTTTISIALDDEARTYIGEINGEEYPMYWSEGDQISVNGVASKELTAADIDGNTAKFVIPGVVEGSYCVAYPAATKGQVEFAAEQTHKDNSTFGDGVTTMYGYGESGNLTLKPLTGILKIGVTGSATLTKAQISTTGNPIAGDFTIDFATGKVTPTSNATNVITYSFGEGVKLSSEASYMHIAVPAGEYNYLNITLFDSEGKVMVANVKADSSKPLTAGKIRLFSAPIAYQPNTTDFYIADYDDLVKFANEGTGKDALVIANITIPADAEWTSIEGYAHTFNGNGYEISGLTAPLFGTTTATATIKNVKLTNVNIESTEAVVGALVCRHLGTELSNCSASGSLKANLASATGYCAIGGVAGIIGPLEDTGKPATSNIITAVSNLTSYMSVEVDGDNSANAPAFFYIGGCTGAINALTSSNLTNNCSLTVKSTFKTGAADCRFGGVSGGLKSVAGAIIENTENYGDVTIDGTYGAILRVGGCAGHLSYADNNTKLNGAKNDGTITISENIYVTGLFDCGGIAGVCAVKNVDETSKVVNEGDVVINGGTFNDVTYISGCYAWTDKVAYYATNNGNVYIKGGTYNDIVEVGGVLGYGSKAQELLYNNGALTISGGEFKNRLYVGGCLAWLNDKRTLTDFVNTGKIEINGTSADKMVTIDKALMVGGCMGSYNNATGTGGSGARFSNSGAVEVGANTYVKNTLIVAGCLGRINLDSSGTHRYYTNDAPITAKAKIVTDELTYIGGVIGYANATGNNTDLTNTDKGVITVEVNDEIADSEYGRFNIGGIAGHMQDGSVRLTNNGVINIKGSINRSMRLGGIIGETNQYYRTDLTNNGDITISAEINGSCRIGGIEGGGDCNAKVKKGHTNTGDIIVTETGWIKKISSIGGIFGTWNGASDIIPHSDGTPSANYGDIIYKGKFGTEDMGEDSYLMIGGMFGSFGLMKTIQGGFTNSGSIEFSGTFYGAGSLDMGGIFGNNKVDLTTEGYFPDGGLLVFSGKNIVCSGAIENGKLYIGGVAGISTSKISNAKALSNIQAIGYNGGVGMITGSARVAGTVVASNCAVAGNIALSENSDNPIEPYIEWQTIKSDDYYNYIYGSRLMTDWTGTSNHDGCTFDSTVVALPE